MFLIFFCVNISDSFAILQILTSVIEFLGKLTIVTKGTTSVCTNGKTDSSTVSAAA